jgi:hypothetical protein
MTFCLEYNFLSDTLINLRFEYQNHRRLYGSTTRLEITGIHYVGYLSGYSVFSLGDVSLAGLFAGTDSPV